MSTNQGSTGRGEGHHVDAVCQDDRGLTIIMFDEKVEPEVAKERLMV